MSKETPAKKPTKDFTPREKILEFIYEHIREAEDKGSALNDPYEQAMAILDEIERRALGMDDTGRLIFCDPDMPVGFIDGHPEKSGKVASGRAADLPIAETLAAFGVKQSSRA